MFKVGEKVVCISSKGWAMGAGRGDKIRGPIKNEIIEIDFIKTYDWGIGLGFEKYHPTQGFDSAVFRKLSEVSGELSEEIMNSVLTSIEEPVEVWQCPGK